MSSISQILISFTFLCFCIPAISNDDTETIVATDEPEIISLNQQEATNANADKKEKKEKRKIKEDSASPPTIKAYSN